MQKPISEMFLEESFDWFRANIKWDFVPDFNSIERNESLFKVSSCFGDSKFLFCSLPCIIAMS